MPEPEIVGPPCAASPPTTKVALRGGGHWVVVGGQVARDEAGNVVGKGDLQAQIEQVGKNVGACLNAGGATVKDIIFTFSYVTQPVEFDKYTDLRQHYFGAAFAEECDCPSAAIGWPGFPGAGRGLRQDPVNPGLNAELSDLAPGSDLHQRPQAIGSDLATKQIGRKGIVITSVDGAPDIVNALKGNTLIQASASQDPYAMGQKALEIGQGILAGKKPESSSILLSPQLITRDNVDQYQGWNPR